ncbi:MAG: ABC transporter permease subunit [Fimbriimonadaceae bacterium]|nr:ABC transporter permease subunit [Fimbriimonadaceae bacterium]
MSDRLFGCALRLLAGCYAGLVALPLLALLLHATPATLAAALRSPVVWQAVGLSLLTATAATLLVVAGALPLAWLLTRQVTRWRGLLTTLLELPAALPPAVAGLGLLLAFGRYQLLGPWLTRCGLPPVALTPAAVVLAQMLVAGPLFLRAARAALEAVPPRVLQASAVLGAGEATTFRRIVLPLARPGLLGGALVTWARALGELGATLLFAGNLPGWTQTMPSAIFVTWQVDRTAAVSLSVLLLLLSAGALLLARRCAGEVL